MTDEFPKLPKVWHEPVALVLEGHELIAILDAILVYDLMKDGCIADVIDIMDQSNDGGYIEGIYQGLLTVRDKIEKAQEPHKREIRQLMNEVAQWKRRQEE